MPMSKTCQNMGKKLQLMSYNLIIGYDIYDRFTMEHFPLRQSMILTTSFFFCSRQYFVLHLDFVRLVLLRETRCI
jgi:hypothetical protein